MPGEWGMSRMNISGAPVFLHAPHRVMFMAGATQGLLAMLWWAFDLAARFGALHTVPGWPLPPSWTHAALMSFGFFPFFIFGFVMTAGPRWQAAAPVGHASYLGAFVLMSGGWLGFHAALWQPQLLVPALGLALAGWCAGLPALMRVARTPSNEQTHILAVVGGLTFGALLLAAFLGYAAGGPAWLAQIAVKGGAWFFLLPVFTALCHRMVPFFSSAVIPKYRVVRPLRELHLLLACYAGHGILEAAGLPQWTWLFDLPAALAAMWLSVAWQLRKCLAVRLLAVLHIAFAWLGVSLALYAASSLLLLTGAGSFGLAPLHALTLGFFASAVVGMVTRVTLGHSGRPLDADAAVWGIFWVMQGVAVLRIVAEFVHLAGAANLFLLAALGWLVAFGAWYIKFAPVYLKPRPDGRPG
jgi:uncharacterized protein involved in response to NO